MATPAVEKACEGGGGSATRRVESSSAGRKEILLERTSRRRREKTNYFPSVKRQPGFSPPRGSVVYSRPPPPRPTCFSPFSSPFFISLDGETSDWILTKIDRTAHRWDGICCGERCLDDDTGNESWTARGFRGMRARLRLRGCGGRCKRGLRRGMELNLSFFFLLRNLDFALAALSRDWNCSYVLRGSGGRARVASKL